MSCEIQLWDKSCWIWTICRFLSTLPLSKTMLFTCYLKILRRDFLLFPSLCFPYPFTLSFHFFLRAFRFLEVNERRRQELVFTRCFKKLWNLNDDREYGCSVNMNKYEGWSMPTIHSVNSCALAFAVCNLSEWESERHAWLLWERVRESPHASFFFSSFTEYHECDGFHLRSHHSPSFLCFLT